MNPILHYEFVVADGHRPERWMLVLAGIFGAGRNWASVARRFVRARPEWGCVLVDLRQHGASQGFHPPHTVPACVDDLRRLAHHLETGAEAKPVEAILGHSFGGKVALQFASAVSADPGAPLLREVWVVDSTPSAREPEGSAWGMLRVLREAPGPFESREAAVEAVERFGFPRAVGLWMSTNLAPVANDASEAALVWRLDPDAMESLLSSFFAIDAWQSVEHPAPGTRVHLIKAADSSILDEESCARIEAIGLATGQTLLHRVEGGHWVNADDPEALQRLLVEEMP